MTLTILTGDNIELLKKYPDNYFDSVVTDCPYGLGKEPNALKLLQDWIDHGYHEIKGKGFMGKSWDSFVPQPLFWKEVFRVLKPGGYVLAFFGTRTYDWGTLAIRLAGFEIRDMICWHYGSGFPKSLDISKAIDRQLGAERKILSEVPAFGIGGKGAFNGHSKGATHKISEAATEAAGWGTALKPATESICMARKPIEGTVAENFLKYGTGGINIDDCRIAFESEDDLASATYGTGTNIIGGNYVGSKLADGRKNIEANPQGRFPANVIFDEHMAGVLDEQTGIIKSGSGIVTRRADNKIFASGNQSVFEAYGDTGGASRFFYCAKASQFERNAGCEELEKRKSGIANDKGRSFNGTCLNTGNRLQNCECGNCKHDPDAQILSNNYHPTVKPIALMRYLQRLVTPKGGKCLDPFAGSGTSGCSAYFEDIGEIVLMEREPDYIPIIEARCKYWSVERNRLNYMEEIRAVKEEIVQSQLKLF